MRALPVSIATACRVAIGARSFWGCSVAPQTHHRVSAPADQCTAWGPGAHQRCLPLLRKPRMELMELLKSPLLDQTSRHKACMMPAPLMTVGTGFHHSPWATMTPSPPDLLSLTPTPAIHTQSRHLCVGLAGSTPLRLLQQRHVTVSKSLLVDGRRRCSGGWYTGQPERPLTETCGASTAPRSS